MAAFSCIGAKSTSKLTSALRSTESYCAAVRWICRTDMLGEWRSLRRRWSRHSEAGARFLRSLAVCRWSWHRGKRFRDGADHRWPHQTTSTHPEDVSSPLRSFTSATLLVVRAILKNRPSNDQVSTHCDVTDTTRLFILGSQHLILEKPHRYRVNWSGPGGERWRYRSKITFSFQPYPRMFSNRLYLLHDNSVPLNFSLNPSRPFSSASWFWKPQSVGQE